MTDLYLSNSEALVYKLRSLYRKYGYETYHMSKFEEYDLYARHKDFLVSDQVITFTDTSGKLMALKPDVTLSIIKNLSDLDKGVKKYCYNENVYRVAKGSGSFKELMQVGLECLGNVSMFDVSEVLLLSAASLEKINKVFVLNVSNFDLLLGFVKEVSDDKKIQKQLLKSVEAKNYHGIYDLCEKEGLDKNKAEALIELLKIEGTINDKNKILELASSIGRSELALDLFSALSIFKNSPYEGKVVVDFSLTGDQNYYNGLIFKGYVEGVFEEVLSGGQYDRLMASMKRKAKAIGFAVYLDSLERLIYQSDEYDVDVLVVYGDKEVSEVAVVANEFRNKGLSVLCVKRSDGTKKAKQVVEL